jgi:N-acetylmuramoyl-L-alanine amidase
MVEGDKVKIVIDAGHGGIDGGAVAKDGTCEADINLEIALKLKALMAEYDIDVVMTREDNDDLAGESGTIRERKREDLQKRKAIIDEESPTLAVSIHLNSFAEDGSVYGAQVFYPKKEQMQGSENTEENISQLLAESVQESLETNISDGRSRSAMAKDDIILLKNVTCNTILVECGFLSNEAEAEKLKSSEYQDLIAQSIWEGINDILGIEQKTNIEIIEGTSKG